MSTASISAWEANLLSLASEGCSRDGLAHRMLERGEPELDLAYATCAQITAHYSRTFFMATRLLPPAKRRAIRALYAFCRTADDLVDKKLAGEVEWMAFRARLLSAAPLPLKRGSKLTSEEAVMLAWADTHSRFAIPSGYIEQFLDGVGRDLVPLRCQTFSDLATYAYGVASTVGLMSMYVIGFQGEEAAWYAVRLGVALQITNVLRDIGEDFAAGRVYLPQDELREFELSEEDLAPGKAMGRLDQRWKAFMRFQIARCRQLYQEARPGVKLLNPEGRCAVAAAAGLYSGILDDIEAHGYDVFSRRACLSTWAKLARLPGICWGATFVRP